MNEPTENNPEAAQEAPTAGPDAPEAEEATFDAEYVKRLRSEAAQRRREAKETGERVTALESDLRELREAAFRRTLTDANAQRHHRLADPEDLITFADRDALTDQSGRPDPARIEAAIGELLDRKPHLAARTGTVTRGVQPSGFVQPAPSLGSMLGRAARGETPE